MDRLIACGALLALAGCAGQPYSILDTSGRLASDPLSQSIVITGLDGHMVVLRKPEVEVSPGVHQVRARSSGEAAMDVPMLGLPMAVEAKPCMREFLAAQHEPPPSQRWTLRIVREEPIEDCP